MPASGLGQSPANVDNIMRRLPLRQTQPTRYVLIRVDRAETEGGQEQGGGQLEANQEGTMHNRFQLTCIGLATLLIEIAPLD